MEFVDIRTHQAKYDKARNNYLLAIIFTAVNMILPFLNIGLYFPFSMIIPPAFLFGGQALADETGSNYYLYFSIILAVVLLLIFFVCWLFSAKKRFFILIALILFTLDTLFMLISIIGQFDLSYLIDIAFHAWVLYYLILGTIAWIKMRRVTSGEIAEAMGCGVAPSQNFIGAPNPPLEAEFTPIEETPAASPQQEPEDTTSEE